MHIHWERTLRGQVYRPSMAAAVAGVSSSPGGPQLIACPTATPPPAEGIGTDAGEAYTAARLTAAFMAASTSSPSPSSCRADRRPGTRQGGDGDAKPDEGEMGVSAYRAGKLPTGHLCSGAHTHTHTDAVREEGPRAERGQQHRNRRRRQTGTHALSLPKRGNNPSVCCSCVRRRKRGWEHPHNGPWTGSKIGCPASTRTGVRKRIRRSLQAAHTTQRSTAGRRGAPGPCAHTQAGTDSRV